MDRKTNSNDNGTKRQKVCEPNELSQETKESCKEIGKLLATLGDRINARMSATRNGQNVRRNCRQSGALPSEDTRSRFRFK